MKPDFPSLADEIAEPHTDMNIKVAAFTVSEKSSKKKSRRDRYFWSYLLSINYLNTFKCHSIT